MGLKLLQAGVAAFSRWRERLVVPDYAEELCQRIEEAERSISDQTAAGKTADRYVFYLHDVDGQQERFRWSFRVGYEVLIKRQERELQIEWIFQRPGHRDEVLIVDGTGLSIADKLAQTFRDNLAVGEKTGSLYLRSLRMPFDRFLQVGRSLRRVRRLLQPYTEPLIIVSNETKDDEILAQLCVHALRTDLFDKTSEILAGLEEWLSQLAPSAPDIVKDGAASVIQNWHRPYSSRSFRDYCRRTLAGLRKDRRNAELLQQELVRKLAAEEEPGSAPAKRRPTPVADHGEALDVDEFVRQSGLPRSTAYRWVREGRITGEVTEYDTESTTSLGLPVRTSHRRYKISPAALTELKELQRQRNIRRFLIEYLVDSRDITERAARAWVRRRLQKGLSFEQIGLEATGRH